MKRAPVTVAVVAVLVAAAAWWKFHPTQAGPAAPETTPTAQVQVRLPERRTLVETLPAVGDVTPGQVVGVSFPRAGQVTRLAVLPGNRVARGGLLATLSPDPATQLAFEQAVTAMNMAGREADRQRELLGLRLATQSQVDAAQKTYADAAGTVESLKKVGGGSGESAVRAPFDGVVLSLAAAQGDRIAAGAAILQFGQVGALRVQLGVEPAERHRVHAGTPVRLVPVVAATSRAASAVQATVGEIQDVVDPKTQLVSALVMLAPGPSAVLVPGMKMRATLEVGRLEALAVPSAAVLTDERGAYVFQVVQGKARRVAVTARLEAGGWVAVDGLQDAGAPVVVLGNYELADGMAVTSPQGPKAGP